MEIWKETAYPGYFISNLGNLRGRSGRIIKTYADKRSGYLGICIRVKTSASKRKLLKIHRLVAEAFVSNPNNLPVINHIDGNKQNNCATNLEWCTQKQNVHHAFKLGLRDINQLRNYVYTKRRLTKADVEWIREHYISRDKEFGGCALSKKFKIPNSSISRIISGESYKDF